MYLFGNILEQTSSQQLYIFLISLSGPGIILSFIATAVASFLQLGVQLRYQHALMLYAVLLSAATFLPAQSCSETIRFSVVFKDIHPPQVVHNLEWISSHHLCLFGSMLEQTSSQHLYIILMFLCGPGTIVCCIATTVASFLELDLQLRC